MSYTVKEAGRNGVVELQGQRIVRTFRKTFGRNDVQSIPVASVTHVDVDRRTFGSDVITVHVGVREFVWKTTQAEELADRILALKEA
jgi:hypothetical protein